MKFYRYDNYSTSSGYMDEFDNFHRGESIVNIHLSEYKVEKETPKGYWIREDFGWTSCTHKKWISKKTKFCWPTKEGALNSFVLRKKSQIRILEAQLRSAKVAMNLAENGETKEGCKVFLALDEFLGATKKRNNECS